MSGSDRREDIIKKLQSTTVPLSATALANAYGVSRQVIVQDIALLRAAGYEVLSTHRGYIFHVPQTASRILKVKHTDDQLEEELGAVVDLGGCVENVMVHHKAYGKLEADLHINSRRRVAEFVETIRSGKSSPLKNITSDYHYHCITADSEKTLDLIERDLKKRGFLIEPIVDVSGIVQ